MNLSKLGLSALVLCSAIAAQASVLQLWLEPATQNATVGQTVTFDLYGNTDGPDPLALSDAYIDISWDPTVLSNATPSFTSEAPPWDSSYWAPGAPINDDVQDGSAKRELLGLLPPDFPVAPVGVFRDPVQKLKITSFSFTLLTMAPPTSVKVWDTLEGEDTRFFKGNFQTGTWDLAFEQGHYSEGIVNPVPEPATLAVLGLGVLALKRRKR